MITVPDWRDYSNQSTMDTFASEMLDSMKDVVVEGVVPYLGLLSTFLAPGQAVSIAGTSGSTPYTTGWEWLALPVVVPRSSSIAAQGTWYEMALHVSNRRGRYSVSNYLRPNITGQQFGGSDTFGGGPAYTSIGYQGPTETGTQAGNTSNQLTQAGSRVEPTHPGGQRLQPDSRNPAAGSTRLMRRPRSGLSPWPVVSGPMFAAASRHASDRSMPVLTTDN